MHRLLTAPIDFKGRVINENGSVKKSALPCLSDFIYPVLLDIDGGGAPWSSQRNYQVLQPG